MEKKDNPILKLTFEFSIQVVLYCETLEEKRKYIISKQLLKSGTSIGANVREAVNGQSKADFIHKLSISQKECDESMYWLEILIGINYISKTEFESMHKQCEEVLKIIKSIIITSKKKLITQNS